MDEPLVDVQLTHIQNELIEMRKDLDFIREHIVKSADTIDKVSKEVMPTIEALMESPIIKMLGMKKGK